MVRKNNIVMQLYYTYSMVFDNIFLQGECDMATVKDYAELSNAAYGGSAPRGWEEVPLEGGTAITGFQAALYRNYFTGELVLAIAGTDGASDLDDCKEIALGRKPRQFDNALNLYEKIVEKYPLANISVTGHSLGGACATYIASKYSVDATVFNVPGVKAAVGTVRGSVQEYLVMGDPFSTFGEHIGIVNWYCPVGGIDSLSFGNNIEAHLIEEQWLGGRRKYDAMGNPTNECKGEEEPEDEPPDPKFEDFRRVDPLILDLNKDGILTSAISKNTNFDHDGNGFAERTAWISQGDGLLVMDRDGNGSIDTGKELFGDQTILANGNKAANGFAALAELDKNRDGKIDANDAAWSELRVWLDNGNGITEAGELKTLDELGIKSLNMSKVCIQQSR